MMILQILLIIFVTAPPNAILQAVQFPATSWSLVIAAKQEQDGAMQRLCEAYWYPVYGYIRARGSAPEEARDLTQEFFLRLLDKRHLDGIDAPRGRFRWFLQTAVKHFLANEHERERAQKRGGGQAVIPLEIDDAERRYSVEPADPATPESIFDRRWGTLLLDRAMERVRRDYNSRGQFDALKTHLLGDPDAPPYRTIAEETGSTEGAVKVAVHRLRRHFAEAVRAEIAETVGDEHEIDAELQFLMSALQ